MAGAFNSDMEEFMTAAAESYKRYETNLESICAKYGREFPESDVICMKTGTIVNKTGTVQRLKPIKFGEAKLAVTKRRADKLLTTLSQSNFDVTSRPVDCQSIYSNYVNGSIDQSHFADDATKILSFIKEDENEPSDAETLSSRDSSNAFHESESETSDLDSYQDDVDGDLQLEGRSKVKGGAENLKEAAWYSLGSSSEDSYQESDTSCKIAFGSLESRSKDVYSKNEDSESTDGERRGIGSLSTENVEKNRLLKRQEGDSGFESGPGKHPVPENSARLFCLNEHKINRVMNWVKNQAKENTDFHPPPESFCGEISQKEQLMSPSKIRKTDEPVKNSPFKNSNSKWPPQSGKADAMNETYTVPKSGMSPFGPKSGPKLSQADVLNKENKTVVIENSNIFPSLQTKMFDSTLPIDPDVSYETQNESGCLTPRRIVRARKRAFTPVQPVYTSEQLIDYLRSPMPITNVEVLSPSCLKTGFIAEKVQHRNNGLSQEGIETCGITQTDQNCTSENDRGIPQERFSDRCQPITSIGGHITNYQNFHLNNLNKNVTKDYNTSNGEVKPSPQRVPTSEFMTSASDIEDPKMKASPDDGITLCEGFGQSVKEHEQVVSEIPQSCWSPALVTRSGGMVSKKQIFDRLKLGGCASEPKSRGEVARTTVRARRQLGWNSENPENKQSSENARFNTDHRKSEKKSVNEIDRSRDNRREELKGSDNFERRVQSRNIKESPMMTRDLMPDDTFISLEEARVAYQQQSRSWERFPENMDTCSEASPEERRPFQTKMISRPGSGYSSDTLHVKESILRGLLRKEKGSGSKGDNEIYSLNVAKSGKDRSARNVAKSGIQSHMVEVTNKSSFLPYGDKNEKKGCSVDVREKRFSMMGKSEKIKSRKNRDVVTKDDEAVSPVCRRKPEKILPASGLSPSTGLSQIRLGSPPQTKPHKKSSKELFNVSQEKVAQNFSSVSSMSTSKDNSHDLFSSPRQRAREISEEPLRQSLFGSRDVSLAKQREIVPKDLVLSPRKQSVKPKLKEQVLNRDYFCLSSNSNVKGGQNDDLSPFKEPFGIAKRSKDLYKTKSKSQTNLQKTENVSKVRLSNEDFDQLKPGDTLRKWKSSQDVKSSSNCVKEDLKICEKDLFLVPKGPSLKPIMSRKKKKGGGNRYDTTHTQIDMQIASVQSSRWTSTPAKGRNVPILNDSMSTIFQGFEKQRDMSEDDYDEDDDDDDDEVQTVSPHSFVSGM